MGASLDKYFTKHEENMAIQLINNVGLKPTGFLFSIARYPDLEFPIQTVAIPPVSMGVASQNTPQSNVKWPGEKVTYPPLSIRFMLNEDLSNYIELYGWMKGIAAPKMPQDFASTFRRFEVAVDKQDINQFSDLTLVMLNSNNNPTVQFTFKYAWPTQIGGIQMDTTSDGEEYLYCDAQFDYTYFDVEKT